MTLLARRAVEHGLLAARRSQRHQALARAARAKARLLVIEAWLGGVEVHGQRTREFAGGGLHFFKDLEMKDEERKIIDINKDSMVKFTNSNPIKAVPYDTFRYSP